jgi:elongator complex protein 1
MSSLQLSLAPSASRLSKSASRIPIAYCFTANSDTLGILWEEGLVEIWKLNTRLGPGRGKALDPKGISSWTVELEHIKDLRFRQIMLVDSESSPGSILVVIAGSSSSGNDTLMVSTFDGEKIHGTVSTELSSRNTKLLGLGLNDVVVWQGVDGDVCQGVHTSEFSRARRN